MTTLGRRCFTSFICLLVGASLADASTLKISANSATRLAAEVEGNYTATHLYVDEIASDSLPITIFFDPQMTGVESCEIFTNLNRRERAQLDTNGDGIEDGIKSPSGSAIPAGNDANYYKAYTMTLVSGGYQLTLAAQKTGTYRLTARYRLNGDTAGTYRYYNSELGTDGKYKRDHCLVISPRAARDVQLYEVNPLTITATGTLATQRGAFSDLASGVAGGPRFSLQYVKDLGANMLWFQPIHPDGIDGRQIDPTTSLPFEIGSTYAVKNFFEVMPLMARAFTPPANATPAQNDTLTGRTQAMAEFQAFAAAADAAGVGIMLDAPFNHTSYDVELAAIGQTLFGGASATSEIRNTEARFFARSGAYDMRAYNAGSIALAPDRYDFGKFADTYEVYYGRYAALVPDNSSQANIDRYKNEDDWFDTSIGNESSRGDSNGHFDGITQKAWRYFAEFTLHWLTQTGYPANAAGAALNSSVGIDALRADFGQGLPPQCWEYIINKTRTRKWNFVFMAESLDGGAVTYRSGRHFDILNENIVFPLHAAQNTGDYRNIYEARRSAYGQALVLLNTSSHDEDHYQDPFHALLRFAANSTEDGVPLIFPGQELGLSGTVVPPGDTQSGLTPYGYERYETNFGKPIPHFKKFNSLMPLWLQTQVGHGTYNYGAAQLAPVYSAIGQARKSSAALRSSNRYFIDRTSGAGAQTQIFSVAKYETANASPGVSDVVFAFVNLDRNASQSATFDVNITQSGSNLFGIKAGRIYNVKNISAYTGTDSTRRDVWLWGAGHTSADVLASGVYVGLNAVPTTNAAWATAPYEAQFLKLYDVTPPPAASAPGTPKAYAIGTSTTFSWTAAVDADGGISGYRVVISTAPNGGGTVLSDSTVSGTTKTVTGADGQTLYATVRAVNNAGIEGSTTPSATGTILLSATGDRDGDGQTNASEDAAGTDPQASSSTFKITAATRPSTSSVVVTWASVAGRSYEVWATTDLTQAFVKVSGASVIPSAGASTSYTDNAASGTAKFYQVRVAP